METAANTVEGLIVVLSCLGRIGGEDRIYVAVGGGEILFFVGAGEWEVDCFRDDKQERQE